MQDEEVMYNIYFYMIMCTRIYKNFILYFLLNIFS